MKYYYVITKALCPWCNEVIRELKRHRKDFLYCQVDDSPELLYKLKSKYKWQTVPMVIIKDTETNDEEFIGGCSDTIQHLKKTSNK